MADRNHRSAREGLRAAEFAVQVASFELEVARASLDEPIGEEIEERAPPGVEDASDGATTARRRLRLRSPIHGHVLRVFEESARPLVAGSPLIEVGNTALLEIVADYLTQDAVKVRPGNGCLRGGLGWRAADWRGARASRAGARGRAWWLHQGFGAPASRSSASTSSSIRLATPEEWASLGDGYRVELSIVLWEQGDVLLVPMGAVFRDGDAWAVFVLEEGVARQRTVELGRRSGLQARVLAGVEEGDRVVLYPSDLLADGTPIEPRG